MAHGNHQTKKGTTMPIYIVTINGHATETRIIDADTQAQARRHVTNDLISVSTLTPREVVAHMQAGAKVERAAKSTNEEEATDAN
jgi:hypothetical protein